MLIRQRILRQTLKVSFIAILVLVVSIGGSSLWLIDSILQKNVKDRLNLALRLKKQELDNYFSMMVRQAKQYSEDLSVIEAMSEFKKAYDVYQREMNQGDPRLAAKFTQRLVDYYMKDFAIEFQKRYGILPPISIKDLLRSMDQRAFYLQYYYLVENPYPIDEKFKLNEVDDASYYSLIHKKYHSFLKNLSKDFHYHDLMLVDATTGNVVYSVEKELDFGTNLKEGPYVNSVSAGVYKKVVEKQTVVISDFETYVPSYGQEAAFIGAPIYNGKHELTGVLLMQLPLSQINAIVNDNGNWEGLGLGETGNLAIVGPNCYTRTSSRMALKGEKEYFSLLDKTNQLSEDERKILLNKKDDMGLINFDNAFVRGAINGEFTFGVADNYLKKPSFISAVPLPVLSLKWALVGSFDKSEISSERNLIFIYFSFFAFFVLFFLILTTVYLSKKFAMEISLSIEKISSKLKEIEKTLDLSKRIELECAEDEINFMMNALNSMLDSLQSAFLEAIESAQTVKTKVQGIFTSEAGETPLGKGGNETSTGKFKEADASLNELASKLENLAHQFNLYQEHTDQLDEW